MGVTVRCGATAIYPLPASDADGPLVRAVAAVSQRWATAFPAWRAQRLRAQGAQVAADAERLHKASSAERMALLRELRGRLRRDFDDAAAHRQALALVGACWKDVALGAAGEPQHEAPPTAAEYAAALAVMRGRLAQAGAGQDQERVAMLAVMALAPWGGGVHVVAREAERAAALAGRLQRTCGPLGISVALVEPGMDTAARRAAWHADITCVPVNELVTDALRDLTRLADRPGDLRLRLEQLHGLNPRAGELVQRGLRCAVLLDAHRLLLDEALRTVALSMDQGASQELQASALAWDVSGILEPGTFTAAVSRTGQAGPGRGAVVGLTAAGRARLAGMLAQRGGPWSSRQWREQRVEIALLVRHVLKPGTHYQLDGAQIEPVEPALGELLPEPFERRLAIDLLAIRHALDVPRSGSPVATMSVMECLLRYTRLGGVAAEVDRHDARELRALYGLPVARLLPPAGQSARPAENPASDPPDAGERRRLAKARLEHRQVAGRLKKLLAFTGRT